MDLEEAFNFLNFWINKKTGAWFTISELETLVDRGQMAFYSDKKPTYATSNLIKEILAPFRRTYDFSPSNTVSGYVVVPSNVDYLDLLDLEIVYQISNRTMYYSVAMVNEDTKASTLNSQVNPISVTSPAGEIVAPRYFRLYPLSGYTGTVTFLKRPAKPVFAYTIISGRVISYNAAASTQLEWRDSEITPILLKALNSEGINLSDQEVMEWGQIKTEQNFIGKNRL